MEYVSLYIKLGPLLMAIAGLKGGSKKTPWGMIQANNKWYIPQEFLLRDKIGNPTQFKGQTIRAYWKHLYGLAEKGEVFKFRTTAPPGKGKQVAAASDEEEEDEEDEEEDNEEEDIDEEEKQGKGVGEEDKGSEDKDPEEVEQDLTRQQSQLSSISNMDPSLENSDVSSSSDTDNGQVAPRLKKTPSQCKTDGERLGFLRALGKSCGVEYGALATILATMPVSARRIIILGVLLTCVRATLPD